MPSQLDTERLAAAVRARRGKMNLREAAAQMQEMSPSTLSRLENEKWVDLESYLIICDWLCVPPATYLQPSEEKSDTIWTITGLILCDASFQASDAELVKSLLERLRRKA